MNEKWIAKAGALAALGAAIALITTTVFWIIIILRLLGVT